jgi:hypothetical protein
MSAWYAPGVPSVCGIASAVDALPCGSRSTSSTRWPPEASAAAMLTAVVVLPTPPFWLATANTRVRAGCAIGPRRSPAWARSRSCSVALASGVSGSATATGCAWSVVAATWLAVGQATAEASPETSSGGGSAAGW